jgi:hypothetical protein
MRNVDFNYAGLRSRHRGAGSGVGVGGSVWASAAPGPNWVAADAITEPILAQMRTTGALAAIPQAGRWNTQSWFPWQSFGQQGNYPFTNNRKFFAAGGGYAASSPSGPANNGSSSCLIFLTQVHWHFNISNVASVQVGNGSPTNNTPNGLSWANGEFHHLTNSGLYSIVPALSPTPVATRYGTTSPGGNGFYSQMTYIAGRYVIWSTELQTIQPRYTVDRINYTNCTIPALAFASAAGDADYIPWIFLDLPRNRLVAVTAYGEILTSVDGITFTKTFARASGGLSLGIVTAWVAPSGKVFAVGNTAPPLAAGQYYMAPDVTSAFTLQTATPPAGKTFLTRAYDVNGTAGMLGLYFRATTATANSVALALSPDEGATWQFGTGGDGSQANVNNGQNALVATEGVFASVSGLITSDFGGSYGDRIATDADALIQYWQTAPRYIDTADGLTKKRFIRVS